MQAQRFWSSDSDLVKIYCQSGFNSPLQSIVSKWYDRAWSMKNIAVQNKVCSSTQKRTRTVQLVPLVVY